MDNGASSYRRFLAGDRTGIGEIIKEYRDGLMLYINGYVKNIHTAEELTEEIFVRLVVKRPRFNEKSGFKAFLYTMGRNAALNYLKRRSKIPTVSDEEVLSSLRDETDIEAEYIRDEQKRAVHRALGKIHTDYSAVLYLIFFEDFTPEQAAHILKKTVKQTYNLIYKAKSALKKQLEKENFVYENI